MQNSHPLVLLNELPLFIIDLKAKLAARHQRRQAAEKAKLEKAHLLQEELERWKQLQIMKG